MTLDSERAFAWLLGELPEADASALDEAALMDPRVHEDLEAFEAELFDAYRAGALSPERRARFEARFAHDTRRLSFSSALAAHARKAPQPATPSRLARWWEALTTPRFAFGALATVAALVVVWLTVPFGPPPSARVTLVATQVRAGQAPVVLKLARSDAAVTFELALDDVKGAAWKADISGPGGAVWSGAPSRADAVAVELTPTNVRWTSGAHRIRLSSAETNLEYDVVLDVP